MIGLFIVIKAIKFIFKDSFGVLISHIICTLMKISSIDCFVFSNSIYSYPYNFLISFQCTGIESALFFLVFGLAFFGLKDKVIIKELLTLSGLILILNMVKVIIFIYLTMYYGYDFMKLVHDAFFNYVQGAIVLLIFILYSRFKINEYKAQKKNKSVHKSKKKKRQKKSKKN